MVLMQVDSIGDTFELRGHPKASATYFAGNRRRAHGNPMGDGNNASRYVGDPQPTLRSRRGYGEVHRLSGSGWDVRSRLRYSRSSAEMSEGRWLQLAVGLEVA